MPPVNDEPFTVCVGPSPVVAVTPASIAILGPARFSVDEPFAGGMEMHTATLAEGLATRGHDVTVYAAAGTGRFRIEPMLPIAVDPDVNARRDIARCWEVTGSERRSYLDALRRLAVAGHDVVHVNAVHHLAFAQSHSIPDIVSGTLHTTPVGRLAAAVVKAHTRPRPIRLASVSASNARSWASLVDEVHVIPNGVDLRAWRRGPGGTGAVWTGRLVEEKAPHLAIDAARLAGMPLRLLGPVHDPVYFDEMIRPRLGGTVEYHGHGTVAELAAAVGAAAVAVVTPTWDEPFGLVVAEALACGTPVAGFAMGALVELLDASTGRLAPCGDVTGLATAMLGAAELDRDGCRARAREIFSVERMIDGYESWFAEMLSVRS